MRGAGFVLLRFHVGDGASDGFVKSGEPVVAEGFEDAAGDVGAARVLHCVVVGEGDLFEDGSVPRSIKCCPTAVFILHGEEPGDSAGQRC